MGNLCNWPEIREIANKYNLLVIEDSADTLGATFEDNKSSGFYTDMSITSFYGSHIINCAGNGGALTLNNPKAIENENYLDLGAEVLHYLMRKVNQSKIALMLTLMV